MLFCKAMPTASKVALTAVIMPEISTPATLSKQSISTRYNKNFIIASTNCCAIFSIFVRAKMRFTATYTIFISISPKTSVAKNPMIAQTLFVKNAVMSFHSLFQSIVLPLFVTKTHNRVQLFVKM